MELKTQLKEISGVRRRLSVEVPAQKTQEEYAAVSRGFLRQAKLPGFRKGKAPIHLVKRYYAEDIRKEILNRLVPKSFDHAIKELNLSPLGEPNWVKLDYQPGSPLIHVAEFEVLPQFEMGMYKKLRISAAEITVQEEDIDRQLEELRKQHATLEPVEDRPIQEGDHAVIDLVGVQLGSDDQELKQIVEQENIVIRVGDPETNPAFSRALFDMNIAEGKDFIVDYERDYPDEQLAGKRVRFSIEVSDIKTQVLPELDDKLALASGEYADLDALKKEVRRRLAEAAARKKDLGVRRKAQQLLLERTPIEAPQILVEREVDRRIQDYAMHLESQGIDPLRSSVNWSELRQQLRTGAENEIKSRLLLLKIAQVEGLEVTAAELEEEQGRMAKASNQPLEKITQSFADPARLEGLREHLLRQKAQQKVLDSAQVDFVEESDSGVE